jgi:hypothetical protein
MLISGPLLLLKKKSYVLEPSGRFGTQWEALKFPGEINLMFELSPGPGNPTA